MQSAIPTIEQNFLKWVNKRGWGRHFFVIAAFVCSSSEHVTWTCLSASACCSTKASSGGTLVEAFSEIFEQNLEMNKWIPLSLGKHDYESLAYSLNWCHMMGKFAHLGSLDRQWGSWMVQWKFSLNFNTNKRVRSSPFRTNANPIRQ